MIGKVSAQVALLAFAMGVFGGLYAGNSAITILSRALAMMVAGLAVAQIAAYACKLALREHLQRRKREIDAAHMEYLKTGGVSSEPEPLEVIQETQAG